jgi:hypothetical protein
MATLTIWHGREKPIRAVGRHQVNLLGFAEKFRGWHYAADDRDTQRALAALAKKGCLELNHSGQFRFTYPEA